MTTYSFNFSKVNKTSNAPTFPTNGVTLTLQSQTIITSGTVTIPTHAFVPIPKGTLDSNFALGLYENNVRIPAQVEVVQTWDNFGEPKWLHVHFNGTYDNGVARTYVLKQKTLPDTGPTTNLLYVDNGTTIVAQNEYIKFEVSKISFCGIQKFWFDKLGNSDFSAPPILNSTVDGPVIVFRNGYKYSPKYDSATTVTVEVSGPNMIVIKAKGAYQSITSATDDKYFVYTNRIIVYDNLPWVIIQNSATPTSKVKTTTYSGSSVTTTGGVNYATYDMRYSLPFTGASNYKFGVDGTSIAGSLSTVNPSLVNNLVAFWKMDETSGVRYDSVYQNHLTIGGVPGNGAGIIGNAALFNAGKYMYMEYKNPSFNIGGTIDDFSVSVWVKLNNKAGGSVQPAIFSRMFDATRSMRVYYDNTTDRFIATGYYNGTNGTLVTATNIGGQGTASPSTGVWYHIVVSYIASSRNLSIIVSGSSLGSATGSTVNSPGILKSDSNNASRFNVGYADFSGGANSTHTWDGYIDSMGVWLGRTLSTGEITTLFNSGNGLDYPFGIDSTLLPDGNTEKAYLHQYNYNKLRLLGTASGADTNTLQKSDGWAEITTGNERISFLGKYIWQLFPKEIELSNNGIVFHYWPQHGKVMPMNEQVQPHNLLKFWNFHQGPYLDAQVPQEYLAMLQVGPGHICTFDSTTELITTAEPHSFSTGQKVQFIRGNSAAVLPTTSPQIVVNEFIYTGSGNFYNSTFDPNKTTSFYYVDVQSPTTFYICTDSANPVSTRINITVNGSGTLMVGTGVYNDFELSETNPIGPYQATMHGVNIYNEFAIVLSDASVSFNNSNYQKLYELNPITIPDLAWIETSNVFDGFATKSTDFPEIEAGVENALLGYANFERSLDYGQFNYGDKHHEWYSDEERASAARNWLSSHYYIIETLWSNFLHSGSSNVLSTARIMTDHYSSVDTGRFDGTNNKYFTYNHGKGYIQWAGDNGIWYHFGDSDGQLYSWLIDANRWYKDAYDDLKNATFNTDLYPAMNIAADLAAATASGQINVIRNYIAPLKRACNLYEQSKDARILPFIHNVGNGVVSHIFTSSTDTAPIWNPLWMLKYFESTRDPRYGGPNGVIAKSVTGPIIDAGGLQSVNNTYTNMGLGDSSMTTLPIYAKAYEFTGDISYLQKHYFWVQNQNKLITSLPGTEYDHYGLQPGPLAAGEAYMWLTWPYYLKQLRNASVSLPNPASAEDYYGEYLSGYSSAEEYRACTIFVKNPSSGPWNFTLKQTRPLGSDNQLYVKVVGPINPGQINATSPTVYNLFSTDYMSPIYGSAAPYRNISAINTSTNIITVASPVTWQTGQFVKIEGQYVIDNGSPTGPPYPAVYFNGTQADVHATLPISTPQVALNNVYYVRKITVNTFKLYVTAADAYADTNPIMFSSSGAFLALAVRASKYDSPLQFAYRQATFYVDSSPAGVYIIYVGGFGFGILQPVSDMAECGVIHNLNANAYPSTPSSPAGKIWHLYSKGYLEPLHTYPIKLDFLAGNNLVSNYQYKSRQAGIHVKITDANDNIVDEKYLVLGQNSQLTVIANNNDGHPTPWFIDVIGKQYFDLRVAPVNNQTDQKLFLYGKSLTDIMTIKQALGIFTYITNGGLHISGTAGAQ